MLHFVASEMRLAQFSAWRSNLCVLGENIPPPAHNENRNDAEEKSDALQFFSSPADLRKQNVHFRL
ncbi:MAG: hypothetical protein ACLPY1_13035 [Terracidiphilus sp.]